MGKIIGIDLGTTNSCAAYVVGDKAEVIPNAEGDRTTPSIVYIKGDQLLVGKLAKRKAILEPKNVIYDVKRFIGRTFKEVQAELSHTPYDVKEGSDGGVLIVIDGKEYKPEQISSMILKKIKEDCEKYLGQKIDQAVITTPAYFNDSQRNATKVAGEIAGLKVERIINEPTAASLAYGINKGKDEKIAVFDLGGGTFDVTLLEIGSEGTFQVLSTSGDTHLGGSDFDKKIMEYLMSSFKNKEGIDLAGNPMALQRLKDEAENIKKQLSQSESVDVNIPFITTGPDGQPRHIELTITKTQYESMIASLVERCKKPMYDAITDSKLQLNDINDVVLVGGSTRTPMVQKLVREIFGKDPKATVNPDESVAVGAAIQGGIIQGDVKDILLLDVTPLSLSVEVEGGLAHPMIPRNTTIPTKKSNTYTTAADNQSAVTVHVTQGERTLARDNKSLGTFNLDGIPPMRRGQAQIEVTFDIDANGILHVSAKESTTGKEQKVTIQGATGISDEEIRKAQEDAARFSEEDRKNKEKIESKNKLDSVIYQIESMVQENDAKLPQEEKDKIKAMLEDSKKVRDDQTTTKEILDTKTDEISKELQTMYQKYQATDSSPTANPEDTLERPEGENGEGPKVVDAE